MTVTLKKVSCGTEVNIVQEGVPRRDSSRSVLSRLAGIAHPSWETRRCGDPGLDIKDPWRALTVPVGRKGGCMKEDQAKSECAVFVGVTRRIHRAAERQSRLAHG